MVWAILNPDVAAGLKELAKSTSDRVTAIMDGAVASPPSSHRVSHQEGARYLLVDLRWEQIDLEHARLHVGRPNTHPLTGKELRPLARGAPAAAAVGHVANATPPNQRTSFGNYKSRRRNARAGYSSSVNHIEGMRKNSL